MEHYPLTRKQRIYLLIQSKINIPEISKYILYLLNKTELDEAYQYHLERWETISSKYFRSFEALPSRCVSDEGVSFNPYSYVVDSKKYVYEKDKILDFYKETGFSFQCRDLLLTTIQNEFIDDEVFTNEELQDNLSEEITECRKENDQIYGILSKRIMNIMKLL